jgi:addiction module HigA family antidote
MMHNPPHPGEALRELYVQPLNLSVTDLAKELNIARKTLSAILNGHAGISPLMAIKLSIAFDTTPESWLEMQNQYDLWQEKQLIKEPLNIRRLFINDMNLIQPNMVDYL